MAEAGAGYRARLAAGPADLAAAQALRAERFRGGAASDADAHDAAAEHLLVEGADGRLLACCRTVAYPDGAAIEGSYAARFYDLARLARYPRPMLEIGRFCAAPGARRPDRAAPGLGGSAKARFGPRGGLPFRLHEFPRASRPRPMARPSACSRRATARRAAGPRGSRRPPWCAFPAAGRSRTSPPACARSRRCCAAISPWAAGSRTTP